MMSTIDVKMLKFMVNVQDANLVALVNILLAILHLSFTFLFISFFNLCRTNYR